MKMAKKISIWAIIALTIETALLLYFNNIYFKPNSEITFEKIDVSSKKIVNNISFKLPEGTDKKSIKVSSDGSYMAYIQDDKLKVMQLDGKETYTLPIDNMVVDNHFKVNGLYESQPYYYWVPDRNSLFIGYISNNNSRDMSLIVYHAESHKMMDAKKFTGVSKDRYITGIDSSPLHNNTYFKIDGGFKNTKLYRIDAMNAPLQVYLNQSFIGNIYELQHKDIVFYEKLDYGQEKSVATRTVVDSVYRKHKVKVVTGVSYKDAKPECHSIYYIENGKKSDIGFTSKNKLALLGIDKSERLYVAELDKKNNVKALHYTSNKFEDMEDIELPLVDKDIKLSDFIVSYGLDQILFNDARSNRLEGLLFSNTKKYKGDIIQVIKNYAISIDGDNLIMRRIKKKSD